MVRLNSGIQVLINSIIFSVFWIISLGNNNLAIPIFLFAVLLISLVKDFFIANIAIFTSFAALVVLLQINVINNIFVGRDILLIFLTFIFLILIISIIFVYLELLPKKNQNNLKITDVLYIGFFLCLNFIFFKQLNELSPQKALKFLTATGEDNAVWLSNLAQGIQPDGSITYQNPEASNTKVSTTLMLFIFRGLINFGNEKNLFTNNLLILQRIYLILIAFGAITVALLAYKICTKANLNRLQSFASSILVLLATYLSFSSFNLFGHLPPIQSLVLMFIFISLLSLNERTVNLKMTKRLVFLLLLVSVLLSVGLAWYPLLPAVSIATLLLIISQIWLKISTKIKNSISEFLLPIVLLLTLIATQIPFFNDQIYSKYSDLRFLVHYAGGTMAPSDKQLLIFFTFATFFISGKLFADYKISFFFKLTELRILFLALIAWYMVIVIVSITSPPHTIDYAGAKLGLFIVSLGLPLVIIYLSLKILSKSSKMLPGSAFFLSVTYFLVSIGPPTGPANPAWTQLGFPFGLINGINNSESLIWETALVESIEDSEGKRILCFARNMSAIEPFTAAICSKFAAGIQGFQGNGFTEFWYQANLNAVGSQEFETTAPIDFKSNYKILVLDDVLNVNNDGEINQLSDYLGIK